MLVNWEMNDLEIIDPNGKFSCLIIKLCININRFIQYIKIVDLGLVIFKYKNLESGILKIVTLGEMCRANDLQRNIPFILPVQS